MKIKRKYRIFLFTIVVFTFSLCGCGLKDDKLVKIDNSTWKNESPEFTDFIEKIEKSCVSNNISGSFIIADDEQIIYAAGMKALDINGELVTPETTYEIGSLTKQFTAVSVLQLVEKGMLSVNDTLQVYFPDFEKGKDITVDQLLHMRSGIVDYVNNYKVFFENPSEEETNSFLNGEMSDEIILSFLYQTELEFVPGSMMKYSNTNYFLLALILERVSGLSYEEYIQKNIFDIYDMKNTSCVTIGDVTSVPTDGIEYMKMQKCARGAGDIHSNVIDLLAFDRALMNKKLLDSDMTDYVFEMQGGYGCGWRQIAYKTYMHSGNTLGYESYNTIFKGEQGKNLYVIFLFPNKNHSSFMNDILSHCTVFMLNQKLA